jgi:CHASE2 domain-containing sensor protein
MRLPVPRHVAAASVLMGFATCVLGGAYATTDVYRRPELEARSVVAVIEEPLGWVTLAVGLWVVAAALLGRSRASAHAVAAVCHGAYFVAIAATYVLAFPYQPLPAVALALFGLIAHGGASIDYWQRGWR